MNVPLIQGLVMKLSIENSFQHQLSTIHICRITIDHRSTPPCACKFSKEILVRRKWHIIAGPLGENVLFILLFCLYLNNDISRMSSNHLKRDIAFIMNSCDYMSL